MTLDLFDISFSSYSDERHVIQTVVSNEGLKKSAQEFRRFNHYIFDNDQQSLLYMYPNSYAIVDQSREAPEYIGTDDCSRGCVVIFHKDKRFIFCHIAYEEHIDALLSVAYNEGIYVHDSNLETYLFGGFHRNYDLAKIALLRMVRDKKVNYQLKFAAIGPLNNYRSSSGFDYPFTYGIGIYLKTRELVPIKCSLASRDPLSFLRFAEQFSSAYLKNVYDTLKNTIIVEAFNLKLIRIPFYNVESNRIIKNPDSYYEPAAFFHEHNRVAYMMRLLENFRVDLFGTDPKASYRFRYDKPTFSWKPSNSFTRQFLKNHLKLKISDFRYRLGKLYDNRKRYLVEGAINEYMNNNNTKEYYEKFRL